MFTEQRVGRMRYFSPMENRPYDMNDQTRERMLVGFWVLCFGVGCVYAESIEEVDVYILSKYRYDMI
jgi:hypothetical protein